jgi:hypothetical protein
MKNTRSFVVLAAASALFVLAGCSEDNNPMQALMINFTGTWSGSFTHPSYDVGTLTLNLNEVRADSIPGTYQLQLRKVLPNGRTQVQNYGGNVENGRKNGDTGLSFMLQHAQFTWDCSEASPEDTRLNGTWRSRTSTSMNGTFDTSRH